MAVLVSSAYAQMDTITNSIGIKLIRIEPGKFMMGAEAKALTGKNLPREHLKYGNFDETPRHLVTISREFYISETEITVAQYQKFKARFPGFRQKMDDDPYVTGISWHDAVEFCKWLSEKEGKTYRLPTEAEWEYVCRAGTDTPFSNGDTPPAHETANPWGVKNMHTYPMEWCSDWHGLYPDEPQIDPVGPEYGWTKVRRGGGADYLEPNTMNFYFGRDYGPWVVGNKPFYFRSANRASNAPAFAPPPREFQHKQMQCINPPMPTGQISTSPYRGKGMVGGWHNISFRVVLAPTPATKPTEFQQPFVHKCVKQKPHAVTQAPDMKKPFYRTRKMFPAMTKEQMVEIGWKIGLPPGLGTNQHNGALVALPNGDVFATFYNGFVESDPDLSILLMRLRRGSDHWDIPSPWPDFLDGNDASPFIFNDNGTIWLGWGCPHLAGGYPFHWTISKDNGATWQQIQFPIFDSKPGGYGRRQPINSVFRGGPDNTLFVAYDGWGSTSGLWASKNNGKTWYAPDGRVLGIHGTFAMLEDNSILCYGTRNCSIEGFASNNVSRDFGKTWEITRSPMPAQGGGQNPVLIKLASKRLLYVSDFGRRSDRIDKNVKGFEGPGAYVCLSDDEGITWRIRKLVPGLTKDEKGNSVKVTNVGYVGATQTPDRMIHVATSRNNPNMHFELNEAWILSDKEAAQKVAMKDHSSSKIVKTQKHKEVYPDGATMVEYSSSITEDGLYVLNGTETWYYKNGKIQWQAVYKNGRKTGIEKFYYSNGSKKWQWKYNTDGTKNLKLWKKNGQLKAKSHWRDDTLLDHVVRN
jgi:formylglycine-generating enzyme required for sulfatase activity